MFGRSIQSKVELIVRNAEGLDVSSLLEFALDNMGCSRERRIQYSFVIEDAVRVWRENLPPDASLRFHRRNLLTDLQFVFEIVGEKINPLKIGADSRNDDIGCQMVDRLMAGVGGELRYRYSRGVNRLTLKLPKKNAERTLFLRNLIVLGIPIALQEILEVAAGCVDSFMLGFLDPVSMSGVSLAAGYSQIPQLTVSGFIVASLTMISQFWGVRDRKGVASSAAYLMQLSTGVSVLYGLVTFLFPEWVMSLFTNSPDVAAEGVRYLRVVAFSYIVAPLYRLPYSFLRIIGKPTLSMNFAALGFVANVIFNGVFIFGLGPCPRLGTLGAGFATLLSGLVQVVIVAVYFRRHPLGILSALRLPRLSDALLRRVLGVSIPVVMQFLIWIVGMNFINGAFGHMEKAVLAANAALSNVYTLVTSVTTGIAVAAGVMMGGVLGKGRFELARQSAQTMLSLGRRIGFVVAFFVLFLGYLIRFVLSGLTPEMIAWMNPMVFFFAINAYFHVQNGFLTNGILYVGGDSKGVLIADLTMLWGLLVPLSVIGTYWPSAIPVFVMLAFLRGDEVISYPLKFLRYRKGKWVKSITGELNI